MTTLAKPLHPGLLVVVDDGRTRPWAGQIVQTGLWPTSPALIAVTDPLDNRERVRGQRVVVPAGHIRRAYTSRWS